MQQTKHTLYLKQSASEWAHAFPIGNGRLGAMVHGGVHSERIQFNEESLWAGGPVDDNNPEALEALPQLRELIRAGKSNEALELAEKHCMARPRSVRPYQTFGDLRITFDHKEAVLDYTRSLDQRNAISRVSYRCGETTFHREAFISAPDQVMVLTFSAEGPAKLNARFHIEREVDAEGTADLSKADGTPLGKLHLTGKLDGGQGLAFSARAWLYVDNGQLSIEDNALRVSNADEVRIYLAATTNWQDQRFPDNESVLTRATAMPLLQLRDRHIRDHRSYYDRVSLELDSFTPENASLPVDKHLQLAAEDAASPTLAALYFNFGRYLLISSSRPGCLPANLQGIWTDGLKPAWNSDFHLNINLQMNYWPAEACNLADCHTPLFELLQRLREPGQQTAHLHYGCRGMAVHHTTDLWGRTAPHDSAGCGLWPMGAAWTATHIMEHWRFTRDEYQLRRDWPVLCDNAAFLIDFLIENERGQLVTNPSSSPENKYYLPDGTVAFLCEGATMDIQIIRQVLSDTLEAVRILNLDTKEADLVQRANDAMSKLPENRIGKHGQLMEWNEDYDEPEPGHRHISHLFGLYPAAQISPTETPELAEAARVSLARRLAEGGGHTGWSRAWLVCFFARLHDAENAFRQLSLLWSKSTLPNLLDTHPPFQIDGNFGGTASIAEMLLQSHADAIHLLPALPKQWPNGRFRGLRARGGITVDAEWADGQLRSVTLKADEATEIQVRAPEAQGLTMQDSPVPILKVSLRPGEPLTLQAHALEEAVR